MIRKDTRLWTKYRITACIFMVLIMVLTAIVMPMLISAGRWKPFSKDYMFRTVVWLVKVTDRPRARLMVKEIR